VTVALTSCKTKCKLLFMYLQGIYFIPSNGCDFFSSFAIAVLVGTSLTLSKSRETKYPRVLLSFRDHLFLLSTCVLLIRIFLSVA